MANKSAGEPNALPVPKGGGATRGLGDGFTPDFNRGTGSYSIKIEVPTGHRGLMPNLALAYNTAAGDGPFGFGWSISMPHIQIDTDGGVPDYLAPTFLFGGESLVEMGGGAFRPRVENPFNRIKRLGDHWQVTDKSGGVTLYGSTTASRIEGPFGGTDRAFAWLPDTVRDTTGNEMRMGYRRDGRNLYLERIEYAVFQVSFTYEQRLDVSTSRRSGFAVERRLRCTAIDILRPAAGHPLIRRYALEYGSDPDAPSVLTRVQMTGFITGENGAVESLASPPLTLSYSQFRPDRRRYHVLGVDEIEPPGPLGQEGYELVDLSGDGLPDVVQLGGGRPRFWQNLGDGRFAAPVLLEDLPDANPLGDSRVALFDADGQGTADLVILQAGAGHYFPNRGDGTFERPRYLGGQSPISLDLGDPNTRFADVDGDGRVDLFQTTGRALLFWRNRGAEGFDVPLAWTRGEHPAAEPDAPARDFFPDVMLSDPGVFVADMTGDGLPDIVHVESGFVEYWPSLAGGRYDRRTVMASPPVLPRHFEYQRLFLADVDGSGTSDLIYVGPDRLLLWRNIGGLRFALPIAISGVPASSADSIRLADLMGHGTVCVLWSSAAMAHRRGYRALSFTDDKPYLLTHVDNGVGLQTRIDYGFSTDHAARDAREGSPWRTRLPMPVPVVDRVAHLELVSGAESATEMFYHDGRWDPLTRRFRGFGRVTARRLGGPGSAPAYEEHRYLVGATGEPSLGTGDPGGFDRARRGQVFRSIYFGPAVDSPPLRTEVTNWHVDVTASGLGGADVLLPTIASTEVQNLEGGDHPRVMIAQYQYDGFGNVIAERRIGSAPNGDDGGAPVTSIEAVTRMEYATNAAAHIVDRLARTLRFDAAGRLLAEVRHYYDGPALVGLSLGQVDRGLLSRQEEIVLTASEADEVYGIGTVDWPALGYHQVVRFDGVQSWAVNRTRLTHSARGMPMVSVNPMGARTELSYDGDELLVVGTLNELDQLATATYDTSWQLVTERTERDGRTTRYLYDPLGRVRAIVRPGDSVTNPTVQYVRQDAALPVSLQTRERRTLGGDEMYEKIVYYDGFGNPVQERALVDGTQARVNGPVRYTVKGEPASKAVSLFRTGLDYEAPSDLPPLPVFIYEYDSLGRLRTATNLQGKTMRVVYTPWMAVHFDVLDTDPLHPHHNTPRTERFDAFGRLAAVTLQSAAGIGHTARYTYDLLGRLLATTDLAGRPALQSAIYDNRGARLRFTHAGCGTRTFVYDAIGRVVRYWDNRNIVVERAFDVLSRLVTESVGGAVQERYVWDEHPNEIGRLSRIEDNAGTVTFRYDDRGKLSEKLREILGRTYRLQYGYDGAGLQMRQVYPDGSAVEFTRWGDGRLRAMGGFLDTARYDEQGHLMELVHANGVRETLEYDISGYVHAMEVAHGASILRQATLTHDAAGHLTALTDLVGPHASSQLYAYDGLDRLVSFTSDLSGASTVHQYDYDADGNLLSADEMTTASFEYDFTRPGALRKRIRSDASVEEFVFDSAGHLTATDDMDLTFDARGRLSKVEKADGTSIEMTYDYRGARAAKKVTGSPEGNYDIRYVDDLYEDAADVKTAYVYLSGRLVGRRRGSGVRHVHTDHRSSVILTTRSDGAVDHRAWFGPYGLGATMPPGEMSRQFISGALDAETGLYYFNHRYYSPSLGRFLSPDPRFLARPEREIDFPEAHNLYAYAKGDPVDYIDPTGQGFWSTLGKVLAGIVIAVAVVVAVAVAVMVIAAAMASGGWMIVLGATIVGAIIGGIQDGWESAALGAMIGFTAGINWVVGGPVLGTITFMGVFKGIRQEGWYKSLAGWASWFMPASWPGHILGLGMFLGNGIAHLFGSDKQIEKMKFDWKHGQVVTAGGEFGGKPLGLFDAPAYNYGGFTFISNETWTAGGSSWEGIDSTLQHETGHMLSNAIFGFWQGIINGIENITTSDHDDRFFERIAESNVEESERDPSGDVPVWG